MGYIVGYLIYMCFKYKKNQNLHIYYLTWVHER